MGSKDRATRWPYSLANTLAVAMGDISRSDSQTRALLLFESSFGEVVVEVELDGGGELVRVQPQLLELAVVVGDVVLVQSLAHVQHGAVVFPGVAVGVGVVAQVTLEDLRQSLLRTHLQRQRRELVSRLGLEAQVCQLTCSFCS